MKYLCCFSSSGRGSSQSSRDLYEFRRPFTPRPKKSYLHAVVALVVEALLVLVHHDVVAFVAEALLAVVLVAVVVVVVVVVVVAKVYLVPRLS